MLVWRKRLTMSNISDKTTVKPTKSRNEFFLVLSFFFLLKTTYGRVVYDINSRDVNDMNTSFSHDKNCYMRSRFSFCFFHTSVNKLSEMKLYKNVLTCTCGYSW